MQKATLVFPGAWKLSKQNSYLAAGHGRKRKNPAYAEEQSRMLICMHPQLIKQGWRCTKNNVSIEIIFYGPSMPCDWDNCGLLTDSMQGISKVIGKKRMRAPGPVVWDDRQFIPARVGFVKQKERKIVVHLWSNLRECAKCKHWPQDDTCAKCDAGLTKWEARR